MTSSADGAAGAAMAPPPFVDEPPLPADDPVVRHLAATPGLVPYDIANDLPYWRDEDVKQAMGGTGHSFFTSYRKIACQLFWNEQSRQMEAAVRFGLNAEGPLGQAHGTGTVPLTGGAIATVFDNVLGYQVIRAIGLNQSTLQLNVSYRRFIPLCTTVRMTCQVDRQEGRKSWVSAKITNLDGSVVHATCTALFYRVQEHVTTYEDAMNGPGGKNGLPKDQYLDLVRKRKLSVLNTTPPPKSNL